MLLIFTPVHGWFDVETKAFKRIDETIHTPFIHYIYDDFSSLEDSKKYQSLAGEIIRNGKKIGHRHVIHCSTLNYTNKQPNLGKTFNNAFNIAKKMGWDALLFLGYNVILPENGVEGFQKSQKFYGLRGGAFAPVVEKDGKVFSFAGGYDDRFGIPIGMEIDNWKRTETPKCEQIPWASTGCLWIPRSTLQNKNIEPDINFDLYFIECDFSKQILAENLDVVLTDKVIVQCENSISTNLRFGKEKRNEAKITADYQFRKKWGFVEEAKKFK